MTRWREFLSPIAAYVSVLTLLVAGIALGLHLPEQMGSARRAPIVFDNPVVGAVVRWDADWYFKIALEGYDYDPGARSAVAFFPLYPTLIAAAWQRFSIHPVVFAIVVAHLCLAACFVLTCAYGRVRSATWPVALQRWCLAAQAIFPTTFFFGMPYAESLFVLLALLVLFGIHRSWPLAALAFIAGLCTVSRPVGIAIVLPLAWHVWETSGTWPRALARLAWMLPLSLWGLLAYMLFLQIEFGDAFAFVHTQNHWRRLPEIGVVDKISLLLAAEPIWSHYLPSSPAYWRTYDKLLAWQSLEFANPMIFLGAAMLIALGWSRRWLDIYETQFAAVVLFIPYWTRSYEMAMAGHGRFAAVAFPIYIVLGELLARSPKWLALGVLGVFAFYKVMYTALFVAGYMIV